MTPTEHPHAAFPAIYNPAAAMGRTRQMVRAALRNNRAPAAERTNDCPPPQITEQAEQSAPKTMPTWEWIETGLTCQCWTKSEARATFKKAKGSQPITVRQVAE